MRAKYSKEQIMVLIGCCLFQCGRTVTPASRSRPSSVQTKWQPRLEFCAECSAPSVPSGTDWLWVGKKHNVSGRFAGSNSSAPVGVVFRRQHF